MLPYNQSQSYQINLPVNLMKIPFKDNKSETAKHIKTAYCLLSLSLLSPGPKRNSGLIIRITPTTLMNPSQKPCKNRIHIHNDYQ